MAVTYQIIYHHAFSMLPVLWGGQEVTQEFTLLSSLKRVIPLPTTAICFWLHLCVCLWCLMYEKERVHKKCSFTAGFDEKSWEIIKNGQGGERKVIGWPVAILLLLSGGVL